MIVSCSDWCAIFSPHNISYEIHHVDFANTRKDVLLFDTFFLQKAKTLIFLPPNYMYNV